MGSPLQTEHLVDDCRRVSWVCSLLPWSTKATFSLFLRLDTADSTGVPATLAVECNGVQADYLPAQHKVACGCSQCGAGQLLSCSKFESHTGSRAKNWKETIRLAALPGTRLVDRVSAHFSNPALVPFLC